MTVATYSIGRPSRPRIQHDNGFLDICTVSSPGLTDYLILGAWEVAYEGADTFMGHDLSDALAAYNHFLHGEGQDRTFDYERYIANDSSGPTTLQSVIADAQLGAEELVRSRFRSETEDFDFEMTSTAISAGSTSGFPYPDTENWQKAIGGHVLWVSADVFVRQNLGPAQFEMDMTIHIEDRYNFNPGQADISSGAPDDWNGRLSCSGLAHQYTNYSTIMRSVFWTKGAAGNPASTQVEGDPRFGTRRPRARRTRSRLRN